ncbi:MAG TPA: BlaI/MecI/CopY family transcriptional regulator [Clostridiaceae bacterium]|nr:BlaI/MecI/CopY family transcriptional regulator [Clostridiaceae bacterium]
MNITDAEWKVMECLWQEAPQSVRQLTEKLQTETSWKRHTVISFLNRLEAKGAIKKCEDSDIYQYIPLISKKEASQAEAKTFYDKVKPNSLLQLISYFSPEQALSEEEQQALLELVESLEEKGRK